jgi:hypothetical protein
VASAVHTYFGTCIRQRPIEIYVLLSLEHVAVVNEQLVFTMDQRPVHVQVIQYAGKPLIQ